MLGAAYVQRGISFKDAMPLIFWFWFAVLNGFGFIGGLGIEGIR
jgi:hypothetical protein